MGGGLTILDSNFFSVRVTIPPIPVDVSQVVKDAPRPRVVCFVRESILIPLVFRDSGFYVTEVAMTEIAQRDYRLDPALVGSERRRDRRTQPMADNQLKREYNDRMTE